MTNNEAYWTERALKRAEEAYLHDAALTAKLFQEYESAAKAIKREISAFYSKYAGKYGLTYDQAVRLLNRKEFQEWKASLAEYVDYIATIQDPKVKALLTAQLDALSANSSISRLEALQGQIDLILNDLFDKGVAQMKNQFGDDFVEGYYKKCYDLQSRAGFFNEIAKIDYAAIENVVSYRHRKDRNRTVSPSVRNARRGRQPVPGKPFPDRLRGRTGRGQTCGHSDQR